jgi:hypothetical protein
MVALQLRGMVEGMDGHHFAYVPPILQSMYSTGCGGDTLTAQTLLCHAVGMSHVTCPAPSSRALRSQSRSRSSMASSRPLQTSTRSARNTASRWRACRYVKEEGCSGNGHALQLCCKPLAVLNLHTRVWQRCSVELCMGCNPGTPVMVVASVRIAGGMFTFISALACKGTGSPTTRRVEWLNVPFFRAVLHDVW